ncbi:hypothetical protein N7501_010067 [Penicillium viridicatum]|nr:hypothetical protein N7501_010067 [Penicillium viridicatum]
MLKIWVSYWRRASTASEEVKAAYNLGQQKKRRRHLPQKDRTPRRLLTPRSKARKKELAHVVEELGKANLEPADSGQSRAHPASGAKIQKTKPLKQARKTGLLEDGALQRFTSGTWVVLKPTSFSLTEDSFLAAVTRMRHALKVLPEQDLSGPKHVEIRKKLWMIELHSIEAARQLAGKVVRLANARVTIRRQRLGTAVVL